VSGSDDSWAAHVQRGRQKDGNIKVLQVTSKLDVNGVYEARVAVVDPNNPSQFISKTNNNGLSTMFPDNWSADRVKIEVDAAYKNKNIVITPTGQKMWVGTTPSRVRVTGFLEPKTTVYPLMEKK
jgi:hypothetical protein